MKIENLVIDNFRGIRRVEATGLGDTVIIAGQNGSGKSCVFDAIRLLKSTYGGYQQNEWQQFFGEFAIQLHGGSKNLQSLFNDSSRPLIIEAHFSLRDGERTYVNEHARELLEETIWQNVLPEAFQFGGYRKALFAAQFRDRQPEVTERVNRELPPVQQELSRATIVGMIQILPSGEVRMNQSNLLNLIFSNYRPRQIGVIDFHGAQRHYGRENVSGINLSLEQANNQYRQHTLYNYNNKYNNVKSEMAGNFVKELLAEKASGTTAHESLTIVLKELFESFFPDKKFVGPRPTIDGSLSFPVLTQTGHEHDLDELSSGEKEILYGYLRIRSSAPKNSIILLDEPELHLNPRLVRGLPEFYRKHLGEALQNQIWLVTHSDSLIREAVGKPGFNVFHMLSCGAEQIGSQLKPLSVTHDLEMAVTDLVGDLASFRPGGKGLIFEGGGDSDFDKSVVGALFAEELRGVNLISGSNKIRVQVLHEVLERAYERGDLPTKFFAVVDKDSEDNQTPEAISRFTWDVYHIENYLLDSEILADVLNSITMSKNYDQVSVDQKLENAARYVAPAMILAKLRALVNNELVRSIDLGFDTKTQSTSDGLSAATTRSISRIAQKAENFSASALATKEVELRQKIEDFFITGTWRINLPGREILRRFVSQENLSVGYEVVRNLIVSKMVEAGKKPEGMLAVIDRVRNG